MSRLLFGEIMHRINRDEITINNSAACEITFRRTAGERIMYRFTDRRNPVNANTINRWLACVSSEFDATHAREHELA